MSDFTRYSGTGVVSELIQRERIEATGVRRIKRIKSHVGLSRYLSYVETTGKVILRIPSIPSIPSPYAPDHHQVYRDEQGRNVIVVATAQKQYDVFLVPADAVLLTPEAE
jgi:hypothetical protein